MKFYAANKQDVIAYSLLVVFFLIIIYFNTYYLPRKRERDLVNRLHPAIRGRAKRFLKAIEREGITYKVYSTLRTFQEQAQLYAQGRTAPGNIVTNARPGQSYHNYGLAIDILPTNWADIDRVAKIGKSYGFEWGGDWPAFKDYPHYQMPMGHSWSELLANYENGRTRLDGYVKIA